MTRTTVAPGVYRDRYGFEIRWRDHGLARSKRFPFDTPLETLKAYRSTKRHQATSGQPAGSFVRDATRFLSTRKAFPSYKSDRSHLRPWIHRFKKGSRFAITREAIRDRLTLWQGQGYSAGELRHRLKILRRFFATIDPDGPNPCLGVSAPKGGPQRRQPRVPDELLTAVALQLQRQEILGRLHDAKTRARFLVLATTGIRPVQLKRARAVDINLDERIWIVPPAKGDQGTVLYLNDEMLQAVHLFIAAGAWGGYDGRSFSKTLQRNGWPKGVRPYTTRHNVGQALKRRGAALSDIQDHLGHRSPTTTAIFYLEPDLARLKATSERLEGRIDVAAFLPRSPTTTEKKQKAKERANRRASAHQRNGPKPSGLAVRSAKTA